MFSYSQQTNTTIDNLTQAQPEQLLKKKAGANFNSEGTAASDKITQSNLKKFI